MPYCAYGKIYYDPRETSYGYMRNWPSLCSGRPTTRASASTSSKNISEEAKKRCELQRIGGGSALS